METIGDLLRPSILLIEGKTMALKRDQQERYIAIWAKAVDTQIHFNEMSGKSRQLGLTFVAAALGIGIVLLTRGETFSIPIPIFGSEFQLHVTVILLIGAFIGLYAVRGLDLNVYHKMLRGAVTFGEDFEEQYMKKIFKLDKGMTQAISHFSRFEDAGIKPLRPSGKYKYTGTVRVTAEDKIRAFYKMALICLAIATFGLFIATNIIAQKSTAVNNITAPQSTNPLGENNSPIRKENKK